MNKKNFLGLVALTMLALSLSSCTKTVYVPQSPYNNNMATTQQGVANKSPESFYKTNMDGDQRSATSLLDRVNDNGYPVSTRPEQRNVVNGNNQSYVRPVNQARNTYNNSVAQANGTYMSQTSRPVEIASVPNAPVQNYQYPAAQPASTANYPVQNRPNKAPVAPIVNNQYASATQPITTANYAGQDNANAAPPVQQDYQYPNAPKPKNNSSYTTQNNSSIATGVQQNYQYPNAPKPKKNSGYTTQTNTNMAPVASQQSYQYPNTSTNTYNYTQPAPVQIEEKIPFSEFYGQRVIIFFKNGAKLDGSIAKHPTNKNKVIITLADSSVYETAVKDISKVEHKN